MSDGGVLSLRSKALSYLRAGAVSVVKSVTDEGSLGYAFRTVTAEVQGHQRLHIVDGRWQFERDRPDVVHYATWTCTCPKYLDPTCPHRAAVQLVVGYATEIRPARQVAQPAR